VNAKKRVQMCLAFAMGSCRSDHRRIVETRTVRTVPSDRFARVARLIKFGRLIDLRRAFPPSDVIYRICMLQVPMEHFGIASLGSQPQGQSSRNFACCHPLVTITVSASGSRRRYVPPPNTSGDFMRDSGFVNAICLPVHGVDRSVNGGSQAPREGTDAMVQNCVPVDVMQLEFDWGQVNETGILHDRHPSGFVSTRL
jgi:hypothetical protein